MTDRAISEIMGYVLVFSLAMTAISVVYVAGVPQFEQTKTQQKVASGEQAFTVLQRNVDDLVAENVPRRGTEIRVNQAELAVGADADTWVNTSIERGGTRLCPDDVCNVSLDPVTYTVDDETLIYENGAVIRKSPSGTTMVVEPDWRLTGETTISPVVATRGDAATGGSGIFVIGTERTSQYYFAEADATVTITVTSPHSEAWAAYFRSFDAGTVTTNGDTAQVELSGVEKVLFDRSVVEVTLR